ncbi:sterol desaturase family protein [Piscinibacter sp. XHJ-5]|uniref:sterol desaturase family protein n=1 Tax=Piscinibacter sp. XHJ-5 TaxID=3037797 RepID=UPI0024529BA5|nr:sterol desaturase family protein [Piscinibacter sp. XHJ-5]
MSWLEILTLSLLPAFLLLDLAYRAHRPPEARGWRVRALGVTAFNFVLSLAVGQLWAGLLAGYSLFDSSGLGTVAGAALGVLVYELVHYVYHRSAHRFDWLWRLGHQMHHSAESLDAWGAYFLHPVDAALFVTWSSLVLFPLLGLSPEAGALATAFLTFAAVFQHANVRTPRWLGWLIQRPESHAVHHARGVHAHNYADLPLWDMVFGTFRNPPGGERPAQGFYDGASRRLIDMLLWRDVSRPTR